MGIRDHDSQGQLRNFTDGRIIFEHTIPRMGKRVDAVVLYENIVFLLEFKVGDREYRESTYDQVYDYALDLQNFQKESHNKLLACLMISTRASEQPCIINERNRIIEPIRCNADNIAAAIEAVVAWYNEPAFDYVAWENSEYLPTPTIVEAVQNQLLKYLKGQTLPLILPVISPVDASPLFLRL